MFLEKVFKLEVSKGAVVLVVLRVSPYYEWFY